MNSPVGCSTDSGFGVAAGKLRDLVRRRPGSTAAVPTRDRAQHADRRVAVVRNEGARADRAARARRGDQAHLRHDLVRDVAEVHQRSGLEPDRFERACGIRHRRSAHPAFRSRSCRGLRRAHDDDRHAVVDAGHLDAVDVVDHVAGRQQRAADRSGGVRENRSRIGACGTRARRRCARCPRNSTRPFGVSISDLGDACRC